MAQLSESEVLFIIIAGSAGMLLLIVSILIFIFMYQRRLYSVKLQGIQLEQDHEQSMIKAQLESQESARNRIGADLHDSLGSLLWGAKINAAVIQRTTHLEGEAKTSYVELLQILDQSIDTVRRIAWELTPEAFHHSGFSKSVEKLCEQFNDNNLQFEFKEEGDYIWNDERGLQAFRIVQELISNAVKHSQASIVSVSVVWELEQVQVIVKDNGVGFVLGQSRVGVGWWNIEHRTKQLGAIIYIGNPPMDRGSAISIKIPLKYG